MFVRDRVQDRVMEQEKKINSLKYCDCLLDDFLTAARVSRDDGGV